MDITKDLPEMFKKKMEDSLLKRFECEFHTATYHMMVEVITGLRSVVGHLMKVSYSVMSTCDINTVLLNEEVGYNEQK